MISFHIKYLPEGVPSTRRCGRLQQPGIKSYSLFLCFHCDCYGTDFSRILLQPFCKLIFFQEDGCAPFDGASHGNSILIEKPAPASLKGIADGCERAYMLKLFFGKVAEYIFTMLILHNIGGRNVKVVAFDLGADSYFKILYSSFHH